MKLLALSCALALTLAAADDQCAKHTVIPGDTCQRAAGAMKTTVGKVSKVLGNATFACSISQLFPGDVLVGCPTANYPPANCSWHTIGENETCASVAKAAGVGAGGVTEGGAPCPDAVYANDTVLVCPTPPAPPTPPPAPTPPPTPLPSGCSAHTVESGDTCQRVAGKLKTTVAHTMKRVSAAATVSCTKSALFPGDVLLGCPTPNYPPANCSWHAVDAGETCTAVANASGVAVANVTEGGMPCPGALFINDTLLVCH